MSRHRDSVQLHYGRDDFADQRQLTRTLSRERTKDMAGDYVADRGDGRDEQAQTRAFANRREIRFPERAREMVAKVQVKARGMFDGFRPKPASPERAESRPATSAAQNSQAKAIEQFARARADMDRMRGKGLPVLPHQESALQRAGDALDQARPHAGRDLASAFERNPTLVRDAAEGRTGSAAKAIAEEAQVRTDPERRADRFVEQWQGMAKQRADLTRAGDRAGAEKADKRMENLAGTLHRDPQLESALRRRAPELGLEIGRQRTMSHELTRSLNIGRDLGMSR